MTTREKLHQWVDQIPENQLEKLFRNWQAQLTKMEEDEQEKRPVYPERPSDFTKIYGTWEDDRTTEEIIQDIYSSRRNSTRSVEL